MSKSTEIQWADSSINPVMGCMGCELWPSPRQLIEKVLSVFPEASEQDREFVSELMYEMSPTHIYHDRKALSAKILDRMGCVTSQEKLSREVASLYTCYAGILHLRHGRDHTQPDKFINKGYAEQFESPAIFPGRMEEASRWSDLKNKLRPGKPWADGLPRLIFVSDMGDALSASISFEYLKSEIIDVVSSQLGQRHIWLWLTKQPNRMALFSTWLEEEGLSWPDNLVAMTSVTSQKTAKRVDQLRRVNCRWRGISIEPLYSAVNLNLEGIDWAIVGGASGSYARPFELEWAESILQQCLAAGTSPFIKQFGSNPMLAGQPFTLLDGHGGNWDEWPEHLRIREFPASWAQIGD